MGDVGDEVTAHVIDPGQLGTVLGHDQHEILGELGDPDVQDDARSSAAAPWLQLERPRVSRDPHALDRTEHLVGRHPAVSNEPERLSGWAEAAEFSPRTARRSSALRSRRSGFEPKWSYSPFR